MAGCHDNPNNARCTVCSAVFSVTFDGKKAVNVHATAKKHMSMLAAKRSSVTLGRFFDKISSGAEEKVAAAVITKTFHCVKHNHSYLSTDCGNKLDSEVYGDSNIAKKVKLGRTKMEAIVKNVLCTFSINCVVDKLNNPSPCPFSVSTDASNKGNRKFFPLAIRFFYVNVGISDYLLNFYEETDESSASITSTIVAALQRQGLDLQNVIAYGADNASVNYGKNCSVFQKLKELQPNMIKANCNLHIIHNEAKHSLKKVTFDVETLVLKVFNSFSCSAKNVATLKECFEFV
jgi:hypothetical protein